MQLNNRAKPGSVLYLHYYALHPLQVVLWGEDTKMLVFIDLTGDDTECTQLHPSSPLSDVTAAHCRRSLSKQEIKYAGIDPAAYGETKVSHTE